MDQKKERGRICVLAKGGSRVLPLVLAIGYLLCLIPTIGTADDRPKTYLYEISDFM